jgi:hypothetical protein
MATLSDYITRLRAMWGGAVQFGGNRDLYSVYGWKDSPTYRDYLNKYRRQDIAKRIINAPVNALWSDPPQVEGDETFTVAWKRLLDDVPVFSQLSKLDKLAGIGRFAILLVGFDDGRALDMPVVGGSRRVVYLQPYGEGSVEVSQWEKDPKNPRYGMPTEYLISPGLFTDEESRGSTSVNMKVGSAFKAHWTRVLHVAENTMESPVYGRSRLESVYNALDDVLKVTGGAAETFWLTANRGIHVNIDKDMEIDEDDAAGLADELDEYQHQIRRIIRTRGVDIKAIGSDVPDPRGVFDVLLSLISAATSIPKRVLMGSEAGQLASQQDRANWAIFVDERISEYGEPVVFLPFVRMMINAGVLPPPSKFSINWPDAFKMNPLERAQTSAQMARSAANLSKMLETMERINQSMARAALPQLVNKPMSDTSASGTVPTSEGEGDDGTSAVAANAFPLGDPLGGGGGSTSVIEADPLMPKRDPIVLLTPEECRSVIGFGKHAPVFDDKSQQKEKRGDDNPDGGEGDRQGGGDGVRQV